MFTLKQLAGASANKTLARLTADETIREWAYRALADRKRQTGGVNSALFVRALRDKNPRVRLQAVIGLARLGNPHKSLLNIAAEPVDNSPKNRVYANNKIIPHIARKALVETGAAQICLDGIANDQTQQAALAALREMHNTKAVDGLIQKLQETTNAPLNTAILAALGRLYHLNLHMVQEATLHEPRVRRLFVVLLIEPSESHYPPATFCTAATLHPLLRSMHGGPSHTT